MDVSNEGEWEERLMVTNQNGSFVYVQTHMIKTQEGEKYKLCEGDKESQMSKTVNMTK